MVGWIYAWDLSSFDGYDWTNFPYPQFGAGAFEIIDDYTTVGYSPLDDNWWDAVGKDGMAIPGHHLGLLVVGHPTFSEFPQLSQLRIIYGVRFVDIYIEAED